MLHVSREERKIGDARWVVDGRDRAEGQGGEGALGACLEPREGIIVSVLVSWKASLGWG